LLLTFDEISQASLAAKPKKNADAREPSDFMLRKAPEARLFLSKTLREKFSHQFLGHLVRPCHALEPLFARVAADFQANPDVLFLAADCDEDESLLRAICKSTSLAPRSYLPMASNASSR